MKSITKPTQTEARNGKEKCQRETAAATSAVAASEARANNSQLEDLNKWKQVLNRWQQRHFIFMERTSPEYQAEQQRMLRLMSQELHRVSNPDMIMAFRSLTASLNWASTTQEKHWCSLIAALEMINWWNGPTPPKSRRGKKKKKKTKDSRYASRHYSSEDGWRRKNCTSCVY